MSPLYDLLRRDAKWEWGPEQDSCFKAIKRRLADSVLLEHYDPSKQLVLSCDASSKGISAVLAHIWLVTDHKPLIYLVNMSRCLK